MRQEGERFVFDPEELRTALQRPQTKIFLFNSPHNPTGKVFTLKEMQTISSILDECPHVLVIFDSVYNFLTFDGNIHHNFATIGNNWDRTITVFSGGKLFNATAWKLGWAIGHEKLIAFGTVMHQSVFYSFNTPAQIAIGTCLGRAFEKGWKEVTNKDGQVESINYVQETSRIVEENRDYLYSELKKIDVPWEPLNTEGGYFLILNVSKMKQYIPEEYLTTHDYEDPSSGPAVIKYRFNMPDGSFPVDVAFCRWMAVQYRVVAMPVSYFYPIGDPSTNDSYVRMAICKNRKNIEATVERLRKVAEVKK